MAQKQEKFSKNKTHEIDADKQKEMRQAARKRKQANRGKATTKGGLAAKHFQEKNEARRRAGLPPLPNPAKEAARQAREADAVHNAIQADFDREQREADRRREQAQRELNQLARRKRQAELAKEHEAVTNLKEGSPARKAAEALIGLFPDIQQMNGENRTDAAEAGVWLVLDSEVTARRGAVEHGIRMARRALRETFELSKKEQLVTV